nr:reverse transcriptase domain-containing protein [Tanacetum cinerariifolium]
MVFRVGGAIIQLDIISHFVFWTCELYDSTGKRCSSGLLERIYVVLVHYFISLNDGVTLDLRADMCPSICSFVKGGGVSSQPSVPSGPPPCIGPAICFLDIREAELDLAFVSCGGIAWGHGPVNPGMLSYYECLLLSVSSKSIDRCRNEVVGTWDGFYGSVDDREETPPPLTKEQIEGHVSALKSLIKSHNRKNKGDPIRLDFEMVEIEIQGHTVVKGKEVMDEDPRKPFKEGQRTPFTRRIIEFAGPEYKMPNNIKLYDGTTDPEDHLSRFAGAANSGEWPMPVWCRMFQQTLDGSARGWFKRLPHNNINEWAELREAFAARFSVRRACFKEPREITKIIRKANESLTTFKERWTVETGFIMGVPKVMKISSFMDSVKSPELAKSFSYKVPTTVNEVMERLDDFVRSEEAYTSTELLKGGNRGVSSQDISPFQWEGHPSVPKCSSGGVAKR